MQSNPIQCKERGGKDGAHVSRTLPWCTHAPPWTLPPHHERRTNKNDNAIVRMQTCLLGVAWERRMGSNKSKRDAREVRDWPSFLHHRSNTLVRRQEGRIRAIVTLHAAHRCVCVCVCACVRVWVRVCVVPSKKYGPVGKFDQNRRRQVRTTLAAATTPPAR